MGHQKAKNELRDAITTLARYVFKNEPVDTEELEKTFRTIERFESQFSESLNTLDQIQSKIGHFNRGL